jgi:polyisoprenoid-binding protein YceI
MIRNSLMAGALVALLVPAAASAKTYTFSVHPKFVNIAFESRMEIEDIFGTTHAVRGWLKLDRKGGGKFRLEVPVASLRTGIDLRDEHLRSAMWLHAARHPSLVYEGSSIKKLGRGRYLVSGTFSMHGQERPLRVTINARPIPRALAAKLGLGNESWVRLRGTFAIKLSDFGVKIPEVAAAKVNDTWKVKISLFAKETS